MLFNLLQSHKKYHFQQNKKTFFFRFFQILIVVRHFVIIAVTGEMTMWGNKNRTYS